MYTTTLAVLTTLALSWAVAWGQPSKPILTGPLAKLDIKEAKVEAARGRPKGTLNIGLHFGLDASWYDPLAYHGPALHFYYLIHDALIKPMPQGEFTYSLAEHAEMTADFSKAAFRLRPGLRFQDGQPLTTADVKWTYESYRGYNFKLFHDKLDRIEDEIFEGRHYGTIFGTLMLAGIGGGAAGPWVTGLLYVASGSYASAFQVAIGCSGLSALAIWLAAPRKVRAVVCREHNRPVLVEQISVDPPKRSMR